VIAQQRLVLLLIRQLMLMMSMANGPAMCTPLAIVVCVGILVNLLPLVAFCLSFMIRCAAVYQAPAHAVSCAGGCQAGASRQGAVVGRESCIQTSALKLLLVPDVRHPAVWSVP
jgi:hypothetical protein